MFPESVILIFGGHAEGGDSVARALSNHYRVVETDNVEEAMAQANNGVDLVVVNLGLPNQSGLQLLRQWNPRHARAQFLAIANGSDISVAVQAMKLGAAECLVNPVDPSELQSVVSSLLDAGNDRERTGTGGTPGEQKPAIDIPPGTSLEELERAAVEQALAQHHGNRTHAAKTLGISVRTLQRKLKAWGMPLHSHYGGSQSSNGPSPKGPNIMYAVSDQANPPIGAHIH